MKRNAVYPCVPKNVGFWFCTEFQRYSTSKKFSLRVTKVEKVTNEELLQKFERNKLGYKQMYGHVKVVEVFHGTKRANITSILTNNLQPKFHGQNIGLLIFIWDSIKIKWIVLSFIKFRKESRG